MPADPSPGSTYPALGEHGEAVALETSEEHREALLAMLATARREVVILSQRFDPPVFDRPEICDRIKDMILASRRARVRVLVRDATAVARRGHRMLDLARRLSTFIEMRTPAAEHADYPDSFVLVDATGVIHRKLAERYEGTAWFAAPREARDLGALFEEMWAVATPDPNLRTVTL